MKKPQYPDAFKKAVQAAMVKYRHKLWLNAYHIDTRYMEKDDDDTAARMTTQTEYVQGSAYFPVFFERVERQKRSPRV